jgi:ribosome recycling factor
MINDVLREAEGKMKKSVESLRHHLASIRTGRATPALVEHLQVEAYGSMMPLNQLAGITVPEARMLLIQPYDTGTMKAIKKAIETSELGLNPNDDGRVIRLILPALTEERRRDLVKSVRARVEESRIAVRNIRREAIDDVKQMLKEKMVSEDDERRGAEKLQELTDRTVRDLDSVGAAKEAEVMEV